MLKIRVDHEAALGGAVSHLWRLGYREDARELLTRALESGSTMPFVYLTALDLAGRLQDYAWLNALRQQILAAECDEALLLAVIEQDVRQQQMAHALDFLEQAISHCPDSQPLLVRMGELLQEIGRGPEAKPYYERAAALGARTRAGKAADQKLMGFVPVLTDRERGSVGLAVREVAGVGLFFLLAGLQDAELSLLAMGPRRWMGVLVSLIGGYLLVTATSSPQQRRIASWLGGRLIEPDAPANDSGSQALEEPSRLPSIPPTERAVLGTVGLALLALALILVFNYTFDVLL
ncbi:MAG: hypothetical protein GXY36_15495 [Chloroflexi bacterium]|nr:hypothetical protein [Chloroflexota bacterium]